MVEWNIRMGKTFGKIELNLEKKKMKIVNFLAKTATACKIC